MMGATGQVKLGPIARESEVAPEATLGTDSKISKMPEAPMP